jgi:flagellar export protein FliJ
MPVARGFERLLRIRALEEEQSQASLAAALAELKSFARALEQTLKRGQGGRQLLWRALQSGETADRVAGLLEINTAKTRAERLSAKLQDAARQVDERQSELLATQIKRKQSEMLVDRQRTLDSREAERRVQRELDEWFRSRQQARCDPG